MVNLRRIRQLLEDDKDVCEIADPRRIEDFSVLFNELVEQGKLLNELENNEITRIITVDEYKKFRDKIENNIITVGKCISKSPLVNIKKLNQIVQGIIDRKVIIRGDDSEKKKILKNISKLSPISSSSSKNKIKKDEIENIDVDITGDEQ